MRLVVGSVLLASAAPALFAHQSMQIMAVSTVRAGCGILLIFGIWTPIAGVFVTLTEFYRIVTFHGDLLASILLATIACALAMLGPGLWSIDARLFGWKRVQVPPRKVSPVSE